LASIHRSIAAYADLAVEQTGEWRASWDEFRNYLLSRMDEGCIAGVRDFSVITACGP
jgi:hypothetical protein